MKLVSVSEMLEIERAADKSGLTYAAMMENAGRGLAEVIQEEFGHLKKGGILALVGSGNNGGDTLVALSYLAEDGWPATAYVVRSRPADDPLLKRLEKAGGVLLSIMEDKNLKRLIASVQSPAVLLDGVLGTGIQLPLKDEVAVILEAVGRTLFAMEEPPLVVAVDCPSGMDCDSGEVAPETIPADLTVSMAAVKRGMLKLPAYRYLGELRVVDIGLDAELKPWQAINRFVADAEGVMDSLPERPLDAHKGTFGRAMVVAGSVNFTGAAHLAGEAAFRVGAGWVTLAVPTPLHAALAGSFPEATWLLLPHEMGVIAEEAVPLVHENLERVTAMLVGPGLGLEDATRKFLARMIGVEPGHGIGFTSSQERVRSAEGLELPPLVVDADGLKLLARITKWVDGLPKPAVLTPHPGEMSVLTGLPVEEIQAQRIEVAEHFARQWGHVVLLKGAFTVIASPEGESTVVPVATPALARAGTGDVLAGLILGLRAQGVEAYPAAVAGAWIHAQAGLRAAELFGNTASVLAGDVLEAVVEVMSELG
ncbi:MAG: NAD(P)H-hydrate dehydratase [Chloroflexota bacterium]